MDEMTASRQPQRRTRRMPTADELRIWREYIETAELIRARIAASLQQESGLSTGDYVVLLALSEADAQRMRSSELATRIGWDRSRLSHHVGRMERRELIRREECPTDNRGAEIVLTPPAQTPSTARPCPICARSAPSSSTRSAPSSSLRPATSRARCARTSPEEVRRLTEAGRPG